MFGCIFMECGRPPDMSGVCSRCGEDDKRLEGSTGGSGRELTLEILTWNFGSCGASDGVRALDDALRGAGEFDELGVR
jgi:hypothetical protein